MKDRKKFFALAEEKKIELGDWFLSPDYVARIAQFLKKNRDNIYSSFEEIVKQGRCNKDI
ncbi:MAG: hypothetical protein LWW94_11515 [Candidatus Desulfofervidaceae bacterium]|nr:hypothetical protein [Candidatus Desulfofervidaceae bacterium]